MESVRCGLATNTGPKSTGDCDHSGEVARTKTWMLKVEVEVQWHGKDKLGH